MAGLVYDSAHGRMCPRCRKPDSKCRCAEDLKRNAIPQGDGVVRVRREVRNGKTLTVVLGLPMRDAELQEFGRKPVEHPGNPAVVYMDAWYNGRERKSAYSPASTPRISARNSSMTAACAASLSSSRSPASNVRRFRANSPMGSSG
ncbi:MAG: hypothetical protein WCR59_02405, partial [Planctomycetota bacterium]